MVQTMIFYRLNVTILDGKVAWNMSADIYGMIREKVNNSDWWFCVAELMFNWVDSLDKEIESDDDWPSANSHFPVAIEYSPMQKRQCFICGMCFRKKSSKKYCVSKEDMCSRLKKFIVQCNSSNCGLHKHTQVSIDNQ